MKRRKQKTMENFYFDESAEKNDPKKNPKEK